MSLTSKYTFVPANSDKVWIRGTSAKGCSDNSDTTIIKVNPLPVIHLTSSDMNNIICKNEFDTFTASGAANYKFFVNLPPEVQSLSPANTYPTNGLAIGPNSVYALGVDTNQCSNYSDTIVTIVRDLPTAKILSKDTAFCNTPGASLPLNIELTGTGGPWTITWTDDAGATTHTVDSINTTNYTFFVHPTGAATTYMLWSVQEHNGADCGGIVKPGSMTVTLWDSPTAQIDTAGLPTTLSAGKSQLLTTSVFGGSGIYHSYVWSGDSSLLDNPDTSFVKFTANSDGIYHLYFQATDNRGCFGRDSIELNVVISKIDIKLAWDTAEVCESTPLQIIGSISGGSGTYTSYHWKGDTAEINNTNIQRPTFISDIPGRYKYVFEVLDNIGTIGLDSIVVIVLQNPEQSDEQQNKAYICF